MCLPLFLERVPAPCDFSLSLREPEACREAAQARDRQARTCRLDGRLLLRFPQGRHNMATAVPAITSAFQVGKLRSSKKKKKKGRNEETKTSYFLLQNVSKTVFKQPLVFPTDQNYLPPPPVCGLRCRLAGGAVCELGALGSRCWDVVGSRVDRRQAGGCHRRRASSDLGSVGRGRQGQRDALGCVHLLSCG